MTKRSAIWVATVALALMLGVRWRAPPAGAGHRAGARIKLKMQASWPASSTFMDNFKMFADRINKGSGGRLEIESLRPAPWCRRSRSSTRRTAASSTAPTPGPAT